MQLEVIGIGGAGCRIADAIRAAEPQEHSVLADVFAFDTDEAALRTDTVVPESHRHHYGRGGEPEPGEESNGDESTAADGPAGDLDRGFELGQSAADELLEVLDRGTPGAADAILVTVGLGGATGGGTAPALVGALQRKYDAPVYVLGTLPADREFDPDADESGSDGTVGTKTNSRPRDSSGLPRPNAAANAIRTLERLDGLASAIVCFDNERWLRTGESLADGRTRCNRELATRIVTLFAADSDPTVENVFDATDLQRVMGNESAVVSLGYGEQAVETGGSRFGLGLFSSETDVETGEAVSAVETVVGKGIRGKLTLECEPESAERALLVVGGPPPWLNRRAITEGRRRLESAVGGSGVIGAKAPRSDAERVFAVVVLADVEAGRLEELRAVAD